VSSSGQAAMQTYTLSADSTDSNLRYGEWMSLLEMSLRR
jgi:hypothetical protein